MNKKKLKICTIGGGSSYTPELIEGFIKRSKEINIGELWLVDIELGKEKLEIVGAMAKRMVKAAGLDWNIHLTLNSEEALKDADYVTTQFRVGRLDARIKDERIPIKYGMIGQETNGAGGIFKAFRTIPVILSIVDKMKKLCPNAWLINFTNPSGMVTEAVMKYGKWEKVIGLCNVPVRYTKMCNQVAGKGIDSNDVFVKFAGINHYHWHRAWDANGKEVTDQIIDEVYSPETCSKYDGMKNILNIPFVYEQVKDQHLCPIAYHRYYYITDDILKEEKKAFDDHTTRAESVQRTEDKLFQLYSDQALDHKPELLSQRGGTYYSDAACEVIAAIENDKRELMVVSTRNNGALYDLPYDCVVEVSSLITAHGAEPLNWGKFPMQVRGQIQLMKSMEECVEYAAVYGDYGRALTAFTINPLIISGNIAKDLLNEMLVANKEYLPQFSEVIRKLEEQGVTYVQDY